ncbi:AI-2E family transporter [Gammaproteobacteria bacterium]|nr:AI-2E family transporter [Gammaproteobacteria bacterium]
MALNPSEYHFWVFGIRGRQAFLWRLRRAARMNVNHIDDRKFLAWLTVALIGASIWIFKSYMHYLLVAAVLALSTSHVYSALIDRLSRSDKFEFLANHKETITALILTCFFLLLIFFPFIYFVSTTYDQITAVDMEQAKKTLTEVIDKIVEYAGNIALLQEPIARLKQEGLSFVGGPAIEAVFEGAKGLVAGVSGLLVQIAWILIFYFLLNTYGKQILRFLAELAPMSFEHEVYLFRECAGTVAVVFYGTLFNMVAQGIAFGLLMAFVGDYDAAYLGVLAGFFSVIPIVGAALVYVPILVLELLAGNWMNIIIILVFAWVVMGFFIDNILRLVFIGMLKNSFGFEYQMNEILILLAILAGISAIGFWGLIIGPSVLALTLAAANLYSTDTRE